MVPCEEWMKKGYLKTFGMEEEEEEEEEEENEGFKIRGCRK